MSQPQDAAHRHQLLYLQSAAWARCIQQAHGPAAQRALRTWQSRHLPVVRCRAPACSAVSNHKTEAWAGLPTPLSQGRQRLLLSLQAGDVLSTAQFPSLLQVAQTDTRWRPLCQALIAANAAQPVTCQVYGSHGWQYLTGMDYLHPQSDLDLLLWVDSAEQADVLSQCLLDWQDSQALRLDGELMWPGDRAVAWREWLRWRQVRTPQLLLKSLESLRLLSDPQGFTQDLSAALTTQLQVA